MTRREFGAVAIGSIVTALPHSRASASSQGATLRVNGQRINDHLTALSAFGRNPQGGVSRMAYTDADKAARAEVVNWMRAASLDVTVDAAANIVGRRPGAGTSLKPIVFGSHIDSVPAGGNFDGDVGSMSAIEVAQTLAEQRVALRHPIELAIWSNEEGGLYGSRAWSGQLAAGELETVSTSGKKVADGITFIGGNPAQLDRVKRAKGDIAAYFELHIEQGGTLAADKIDIGIVEGIVGIQQWDVTITGFANHAGTTPMNERHDALLTAARFIEMVNRVVRSVPGRQVGTVGKIQALPGAPNVIPGEVRCTLELRDLDDAKIGQLFGTIKDEAAKIGAMNQTTLAFAPLHTNVAAPSDPKMRALIADATKSLGLSSRVMPSGAGHDAQAMAQLGLMGMIFVPSIAGISHSPKEFSRPADIVNGANVLLATIVAADKALG